MNEKQKILNVIQANTETLLDEAKDFDPLLDSEDFPERVIELSNEIANLVKTLKIIQEISYTEPQRLRSCSLYDL